MLHPSGLRRPSHVLGIGLFLFRRKMRPEKRDAVGAVGSGKCLFQTLFIIDAGCNDFRAECGESLRLVAVHISRDRTRGEFTALVRHDGLNQSATLRTGRAHYCNYFFSHVSSNFQLSNC
jgi:hypothetical protein